MAEHFEILVEEPSMEQVVRVLVPRIAPMISFSVYASQGKQDLLKNLPSRLRGYNRWIPESWRIIVLVDRDDSDCEVLKDTLEDIVSKAGLVSKRNANGGRFHVVTRIAIEELEAWYFGDWAAVCAAYPRVDHRVPGRASYRDPDAIVGGTWEAFERVLNRYGYFASGLRKIEAANKIGPHMSPERNLSRSFSAFCDAFA